ncbi:hypothetical protein LTR53_017128, partial [Teratosphaeriaceae sp. CCFEE 6253]
MSLFTKAPVSIDGPQSTSDIKPLLSPSLSPPPKTYGTSATSPSSRASPNILPFNHLHIPDDHESFTDDMDGAFEDRQPMKPAAFYKMIGLRPPPDTAYVASLADLEEGSSGLYHDLRTSHARLHRAFLYLELGVYAALLGQILLSANFVI